MIRQYYKTLSLTGLLLASLGCSNVVFGVCVRGSTPTTNIGTITAQRDTAVGQPISEWIESSQSVVYTECYYDDFVNYTVKAGVSDFSSLSSVAYNGYRVFNSPLSGVGFIIEARTQYGNQAMSSWLPLTSLNVVNTSYWIGTRGDRFSIIGQTRLKFIKTANIAGGPLNITTPHYVSYVDGKGVSESQFVYAQFTGTLKTAACSITTPVIQVPLDDVNSNDLVGIGTTVKPREFNIGLNCNADARVNAMMTGVKNTDTSTDGVLQLTNSGGTNVATGVGIQILYNSIPLALNNNIILKTSLGGVEIIPFVAQYYQTKRVVMEGQANATATLNLTYQ